MSSQREQVVIILAVSRTCCCAHHHGEMGRPTERWCRTVARPVLADLHFHEFDAMIRHDSEQEPEFCMYLTWYS